jgi:hypothetical protein
MVRGADFAKLGSWVCNLHFTIVNLNLIFFASGFAALVY